MDSEKSGEISKLERKLEDLRKKLREAELLAHRLKSEELATHISSHFISLTPMAIEDAIDHSLRQIGEFFNADRCYIFEYRAGGRIMDNSHEWVRPGIVPFKDTLQNLPADEFYVARELMKKNLVCHVPRVSDIAPDAGLDRADFERNDIKSLLSVPMVCAEEHIGFLGMDSVWVERSWTDDEIDLLKRLGDIFAVAIARKRTDRLLHESEERLRMGMMGMGAAIWDWDIHSNRIYFSDLFLEMFGYTREDLKITTQLAFEHLHPDDLPRVIEAVTSYLKRKIDTFELELRYRCKDGSYKWVLSRAVASWNEHGVPMRMVGSYSDITKRKMAEDALHDSEARYRSLTENTPDVVLRFDREFRHLYASPSIENVVHLKAGDFIGKTHRELGFSESEVDFWENTLRAVFDSGKPFETELEFNGKNGPVVFNWRLVPERNEHGEIVSLLSLGRDITEHRRSEKNYRMLFDSMLDAFALHEMIYDRNGAPVDYRFLDANPAFYEMTGLKAEDVIGRTVLEIMPNTEPYWIEKYGEVALTGTPSRFEDFSRELGKYFDVMVFRPQKDRFAVIFKDVTRQKTMEEELLKVRKLDSVGVLAGGIAHDFNNILTTMWGNISLAKMELDDKTEASLLLDEAEKACKQARDLTQQLLTFSKGGAPVRKTADIAELIMDSARFSLRGSNVRPEFDISDPWPVDIDVGQISQVINNIVINAKQAMPEGGKVLIGARNIEINEANNNFGLPLKNGRYVVVSIKDFGMGILDEHLDRIFDPYFSTKQTGSGLGLATCYSIVSKHDGYIDVMSEVGEGSEFIIYLPASERQIEVGSESTGNIFMGKGRILIMDDERSIRALVGNMLDRMGYESAAVEDGRDVLPAYEKAIEDGNPFDLVIMDLTIPGGMGGKEAAGLLKNKYPEARVIVASGYSNDPVMSNFTEHGFSGVVSKPFRIEELSDLLQKILGEKN